MREATSDAAGVQEASESEVRRRALPVVLTLSMGLGAFPMVTLSALSPYAVNDLGIGRAASGAIPTVMFVTAIAASIVVGRTVDRFGPRAVLAALHLIAAPEPLVPPPIPAPLEPPVVVTVPPEIVIVPPEPQIPPPIPAPPELPAELPVAVTVPPAPLFPPPIPAPASPPVAKTVPLSIRRMARVVWTRPRC